MLGYHCQFAQGFPKSLAPVIKWLFDGNLGVRFFFLISGFLITHLLLQEFNQTGTISLRKFYTRRALRILPVYLIYLLVLCLLQTFTVWHQLPITWTANLTFTTDFLPLRFFNEPTNHLWSLAVEEQFYLLWPLLLIQVGLKGSNRTVFYILGAPLVVAPMCRVIAYLNVSPTVLRPLFNDFSFLVNFDSLAVGCIAAIFLIRNESQVSAALKRYLWESICLALFLVLVPYVCYRLFLFGIFMVPLGNTLQAVGFAILLLQSILSPQYFEPLNWPVIKTVGILSYSIYIWQQIFMTPPYTFGFSNLWFMSFPGWLLAACSVAALSYYGLEKPLTGLRAYFRKPDFSQKTIPLPIANR